MIIPGHGRLCDEQDVIEYRDMVTIVRDRIQDMIKKGMTLEQVQGGEADARLRSALRHRDRVLDDGDVHRNHLPRPEQEKVADRSRGTAPLRR